MLYEFTDGFMVFGIGAVEVQKVSLPREKGDPVVEVDVGSHAAGSNKRKKADKQVMLGGSEDVAGSLDEWAMLAGCQTNLGDNCHLIGRIVRPIDDLDESRRERLNALDNGTKKRRNAGRVMWQRELLAVWRSRLRGAISRRIPVIALTSGLGLKDRKLEVGTVFSEV